MNTVASQVCTPPIQQSKRLRVTALALTIGTLAAIGVFLLPLLFPPSHPSVSAAYTAGFNNRVAVVAAVLVAVLSFALASKFRLFPSHAESFDSIQYRYGC